MNNYTLPKMAVVLLTGTAVVYSAWIYGRSQKQRLSPLILWGLIIPTLIFALIFTYLGFALEQAWQAYAVNMGTTYIGILLTVLFLNILIEENERRRWKQADSLIRERIRRFANSVVGSFCEFDWNRPQYSPEIFTPTNDDSEHYERTARSESIKVIKDRIVPELQPFIESRDRRGWRSLRKKIEDRIKEADLLITVFGNRLDPDIWGEIFQIVDHLESIKTQHAIAQAFRVIGVSDEELQKRPAPFIPIPEFQGDLDLTETKRILIQKSIEEATHALKRTERLLERLGLE